MLFSGRPLFTAIGDAIQEHNHSGLETPGSLCLALTGVIWLFSSLPISVNDSFFILAFTPNAHPPITATPRS